MGGFFSKLGNLFSKVSDNMGVGPYHRRLDSLIREENRLIQQKKDPLKSESYRKLAQECRELAEKHGIENHPG